MNENEQSTQRVQGPTKKQDNEKFFENRLYYQGFEHHLAQPLRNALKEGKDEFKLKYEGEFIGHFGKPRAIDYEVNFKKDQTLKDEKGQPLYYLNSMKATLLDEKDPSKDRSHLFYMQNDRGITTKEAFNMLEGRAVKKTLVKTKKDEEGKVIFTPGEKPETYQAWLQLDLTKRKDANQFEQSFFHEKYNYDLNRAVSRFDIKGMENEKIKASILTNLEKGNLVAVTLDGQQESKAFLQANPKDHNVLAYNSNWELVRHGMRQRVGEPAGRIHENDNGHSQGAGNTNSTAPRNESTSDKDTAKGKGTDVAQSTNEASSTTKQNGKQQNEEIVSKKGQGQESGKKRTRSIGA